MRAPARTWGSAGKPRLRHDGECIGMYVAEKSAVGRIRHRRFITAQMRGNSVGYGGVAGNITTWFRVIAHQARCVRQKKTHPANDWLLQSLCHCAPLRMHYAHALGHVAISCCYVRLLMVVWCLFLSYA